MVHVAPVQNSSGGRVYECGLRFRSGHDCGQPRGNGVGADSSRASRLGPLNGSNDSTAAGVQWVFGGFGDGISGGLG